MEVVGFCALVGVLAYENDGGMKKRVDELYYGEKMERTHNNM